MNTQQAMKPPCLLVIAIAFALLGLPAFGQDEAALQKFIDEAIAAGGGEVVIPPGEYIISKGLVIKDAKNLKLAGIDGERTVLRLAPLAYARSGSAVIPAGAREIPVSKSQNLKVGEQLHIESDGDVDSFTNKPKPYHLAVLKQVTTGKLILQEPLKHPVPANTLIRHADAPNIIQLRGACEGVLIRKLTLDGGKTAKDPALRGHAQLCGIFASGLYTYEKGPTGPPIKGLRVEDCIIQNCFGRGIILYSTEGVAVERCTIMDTHDEGLGFDHFTTKATAKNNHFARCLTGIEMNDANDCVVEANEFRDSGTGIHIWRWCKMEDLNRRNIVRNNLFLRTTGNGIQLGKGTQDNEVSGNEFDGCGRNGISVSGSNQRILRNEFTNVQLKPVQINEGTHEVKENRPSQANVTSGGAAPK